MYIVYYRVKKKGKKQVWEQNNTGVIVIFFSFFSFFSFYPPTKSQSHKIGFAALLKILLPTFININNPRHGDGEISKLSFYFLSFFLFILFYFIFYSSHFCTVCTVPACGSKTKKVNSSTYNVQYNVIYTLLLLLPTTHRVFSVFLVTYIGGGGKRERGSGHKKKCVRHCKQLSTSAPPPFQSRFF